VVGADEFDDALGGQGRREAFLPVIVATFDFALGLGGAYSSLTPQK
jgi:hypothetical protein